jgi:hypothetical protein
MSTQPAGGAVLRTTGVAIDAGGTLFVTDFGGQVIRRIKSPSNVETLAGALRWRAARRHDRGGALSLAAGSRRRRRRNDLHQRHRQPSHPPDPRLGRVHARRFTRSAGSVDGTGPAARFNGPDGIALDRSGNLWISETTATCCAGSRAPAWSRLSPAQPGRPARSTARGQSCASTSRPAWWSVRQEQSTSPISATRQSAAACSTRQLRRSPRSRRPAVSAGADATFEAAVAGYPPPALRWQRSADGGGSWSDLAAGPGFAGVHTTILRVIAAPESMTGNLFRLVAHNEAGADAVSSAVALTVDPPLASGVYSGSLGGISGSDTGGVSIMRTSAAAESSGSWALILRPDATATFIAFIAATRHAVVQNFVVASDGFFYVSGLEIAAQSGAIVDGTPYTLTGQIVNGVVTAQLSGLGLTFSGAVSPTSGSAAAYTGLYSASALMRRPARPTPRSRLTARRWL